MTESYELPVLIVIKIWGVREMDRIWFQIMVQSARLPELVSGLAIVMTVLLLGPLDLWLDKIWKKPGDPVRLRVELSQFLNPEKNSIFYGGKWLSIGANTIENIYPPENRHAWMDHPADKASDITVVKRLVDILKGYEKSLEAVQKEQEWLQKHKK